MNYKVYIENAAIGSKLSLDNSLSLSKEVARWAVEEDLNGPSLPTMVYREKTNGRIAEYIYGFYKEGMIVTLTLYGPNGTIVSNIENVKLQPKK